MKKITVVVAANITYSGFTFNTKLVIEYEHTGKQYFKNPHHYTECEEIAERWRKNGKNVSVKHGYYYIKRLAMPTITSEGKRDIWYINNPGDAYRINKVSKYAQKLHAKLSEHQPPIINKVPI